MGYIDKKFMVVSRVMGDKGRKTFCMTILRPLAGTLAASFIQCFFLAFTDFGIPASVGGQYEVVASVLYDEMLGSIPNFHNGAVVAIVMLIPSIVSIGLLCFLERYNVRYNKISPVENRKNPVRDGLCAVFFRYGFAGDPDSVCGDFPGALCGRVALSDVLYTEACERGIPGQYSDRCLQKFSVCGHFNCHCRFPDCIRGRSGNGQKPDLENL